MERYKNLLILILMLFLTTCITDSGRYLIAGDSGKIYYVHTGTPPFVLAVPKDSWEATAIGPNHVLLKTTAYSPKTVNIFDYGEGLFTSRFYKEGSTEEQALERYYESESAYHLSKSSGLKSEIVKRNIDGINKPNMLWKIEGLKGKVVWLTTSKDRRLISVSWADGYAPFGGEQEVMEIMRSLKFVSKESAEYLLSHSSEF